MSNESINIVSFNIWGLPDFITMRSGNPPSLPHVQRSERMRAIGRHVIQSNQPSADPCQRIDVICFQEAWIAADRAVLAALCRDAGLPHAHYFNHGFVGSGLLIVSRFPFQRIDYLPYPLNGKPQRLQHGDWWTGKGVGYAQLGVPPGFLPDHPQTLPYGFSVHVFNTHTHAKYSAPASDEYHGHRLCQMQGFAEYVRRLNGGPQDLVVATGDFNAKRSTLDMRLFLYASGLVAAPLEEPVTTSSNGGQIDFICYRPSATWCLAGPSVSRFRGTSPYYRFVPADPDAAISYYSDHLAVFARFVPTATAETVALNDPPVNNPYPELRETIANFSVGLQTRLQTHTTRSLFFFFTSALVAVLFSQLDDAYSILNAIVLSLGVLLLLISLLSTILKVMEISAIRTFQRSIVNNL